MKIITINYSLFRTSIEPSSEVIDSDSDQELIENVFNDDLEHERRMKEEKLSKERRARRAIEIRLSQEERVRRLEAERIYRRKQRDAFNWGSSCLNRFK